MSIRRDRAGRRRPRAVGTVIPIAAGLAGLGLSPATAPAASAAAASAPAAWTVYHGDAGGSGDYSGAIALRHAHAVWTSPSLTGQLYGEPLIAGQSVYVATTADVVYALDSSTGAVQWSTTVGTPVSASALPCGDISPTVGIVGTPVIDTARHELYAVADESIGGSPAHHLVGLDTSTGKVVLDQDVDPPGSDPAAQLQRTGLNLTSGRVVFGFGGNSGDCSTYHGWVLSAPVGGGSVDRFEVDALPGNQQGAIWMGGAAPVVDSGGHVWVASGNGSNTSGKPNGSDSVLELTPTMHKMQSFTPAGWASDNASDADLGSSSPAVLADGLVVQVGKSQTAYLLEKTRLAGIGGQKATKSPICGADVDGGDAFVGSTVYLACQNGPVAVHAASVSGFGVAWSASVSNAGPPIVAGGFVWTIDGAGHLDALDPSTGAMSQQLTIGSAANHFPTPAIGDGLLLAPASSTVVAFAGS